MEHGCVGILPQQFWSSREGIDSEAFFSTWHLLRHTAALEGTAAAAAAHICAKKIFQGKKALSPTFSLSYLVSGWLDSEAGKQVELRQ